MRRIALIGHSGFIGQHLSRELAVTDTYNRQTIAEIRGKSYDWIVCAAPSSHKLLANRAPDRDQAQVAQLLETLQTVDCQHLLLLSTISSQDAEESQQPYGAHRRWLENGLSAHFGERLHILHLPMVFGPGASKGLMRDLIVDVPLYLREDVVARYHLEAYYQFCGLGDLFVFLGQVTPELRQTLSFAELSSRDFWPLEQRHEAVFAPELAKAVARHIQKGQALTYPVYQLTGQGVLETLAGHPPAAYPPSLITAIRETQMSYLSH